jgi:hypothetical protein
MARSLASIYRRASGRGVVRGQCRDMTLFFGVAFVVRGQCRDMKSMLLLKGK